MKIIAASLSRPPTNHDGMSFVSASIAVQVQTSPAFAGAAFARAGRVSFLVCPRHALFKLAHYASRALLDTGIGGR
jgi:hypothetical protein